MSFQEAMELMLKTTTIDDMELVVIIAPGHRRVLKAMELVVTTTTMEDMELLTPKLVVVTTTYTVLALVTSPACKNTTFLGSFARRRGAGTFFK